MHPYSQRRSHRQRCSQRYSRRHSERYSQLSHRMHDTRPCFRRLLAEAASPHLRCASVLYLSQFFVLKKCNYRNAPKDTFMTYEMITFPMSAMSCGSDVDI